MRYRLYYILVGPTHQTPRHGDMQIDNGFKIQDNVSIYKVVTSEDYAFCGHFVVFSDAYKPQTHIGCMDELGQTLLIKGG